MITIVSIFLAVLIVTSGAFLLLDNRMRRADLDRTPGKTGCCSRC